MSDISFKQLWGLLAKETTKDDEYIYSNTRHLFKDIVSEVYDANKSKSVKQVKEILNTTEIW